MVYRIFVLAMFFPALVSSYTVVRSDGRQFSGRLIQQTQDAILLEGSDGVTIRFKSEQIDWDRTTNSIQNHEQQMLTATRRMTNQNELRREGPKVKKWSGEAYSFDFKDIDIRDLFRFIADISGLNVILDPAIKGTVTLKLTEVPWDQALDLITRNQGLAYTLEGNVIRIARLAKFEQEEIARAKLEEERRLNALLITKIIPLSYAKAAEIEPIIKTFLTRRGSTIIDRRTNILIVTDTETNYALWDALIGI